MMNYSEDLRRVAKRVVWFKPPEETLNETKLFLAHVMTYGTLEDIVTAMKYYTDADFEGVSRLLCKRPRFVFGDGVPGKGAVPLPRPISVEVGCAFIA